MYVLSSSYIVSSLDFWNKRELTQQRGFRVANDIVFNKVSVYQEKVYVHNVVIEFWFVGSISTPNNSKFITNITSENVFYVHTKNCKTRSFICRVNLIFLITSRHFNFGKAFAVVVFFPKEVVHGFSNNRNGKVQTKFQII